MLNAIKLYIKNVYAVVFAKKNAAMDKCDVLFLHHKLAGIQRTKRLSALLINEGYKVGHEIINVQDIFIKRKFLSNQRIGPMRLCWQELYVAYLIKVYQPKVLLSFMDSSPMSIFIKEQMNQYGGKYINVAHCVTWTSERFSMYHFHYYFIFGASSVKHVLNTKIRYGDTKLVETGSIYVPETMPNDVDDRCDTIVFFSTYLPDEYKESILSSYKVLSLWHEHYNERKLLIKIHPHQDDSIIRGYFKDSKNVEFLPSDTLLNEVMERAFLSIVWCSNTAIESSLMKRPVIMLNTSDIDDSYLHIEEYFGIRVKTPKELNRRVTFILENHEKYIEKCDKYVKSHFSRRDDSVSYSALCIKSVLRGGEDFPVIPVQSTDEYFKGC